MIVTDDVVGSHGVVFFSSLEATTDTDTVHWWWAMPSLIMSLLMF